MKITLATLAIVLLLVLLPDVFKAAFGHWLWGLIPLAVGSILLGWIGGKADNYERIKVKR